MLNDVDKYDDSDELVDSIHIADNHMHEEADIDMEELDDFGLDNFDIELSQISQKSETTNEDIEVRPEIT